MTLLDPRQGASALQTGSVAPLRQALTRQPLPHTNNAYQIFGLSKAEMPITDQLLVQWKLWLDGSDWRNSPPPLARVHAWFRTMYRFGDFTAGQFLAVIKYALPFDQAPDWWNWAVPGPGSRGGLSLALGKNPKASWDAADWLTKLQTVAKVLTPRLEAAGVSPLHMQDWQNVMCETSKLWRIANGGKAKNCWRPPLERLPANEADLTLRMEELHADARRRFAASLGSCGRRGPRCAPSPKSRA